MNIIDILILLVILLFGVLGFQRGFFKQTVIFVGELLVLILAFILKNPIGNWLCVHLPFFDIGGMFKGIQSINIFIYQLIGFIIVAGILSIILSLLITLSGVVEKILKLTIILGIPSKILGFIVGLVEGVVICFVALFLLNQPLINKPEYTESSVAKFILNHMPGLSNAVSPTVNAIGDIYTLTTDNSITSDEYNAKAIDIMLKYKVVQKELIEELIAKEKLSGEGLSEVLSNY